jgi:hypothetical protein
MRWEGQVARMMDDKLWLENLKGERHLKDFGIDGRIT